MNGFAGMANENGVFDFSAAGKSCMIVGGVNIGAQTLPVDTERVEDCLYAKILARKDAVVADDQKNVLTWIHGGTFNFGGVDVSYENPDNLVAENDIIVAKVNYRLGESKINNFSNSNAVAPIKFELGDVIRKHLDLLVNIDINLEISLFT